MTVASSWQTPVASVVASVSQETQPTVSAPSELDARTHAEMTISSVNTSPSNLETATNADEVVTDDTANGAPSRERRRTAASTASAASSGTWMPPVTQKPSRRASKQQMDSMNLRQKFNYNATPSSERVQRHRSSEAAPRSKPARAPAAAVQSSSQGKVTSGHSTPVSKKATPSASPSAAAAHELDMSGSDVMLPEVAGSSSDTKTRSRRSFIGQAWRSTRVEQLRQLNRKLSHRRNGDDRPSHVSVKELRKETQQPNNLSRCRELLRQPHSTLRL